MGSLKDPEQLRADRKRYLREIANAKAQGLAEEHPNIVKRRSRIKVIDKLLEKADLMQDPRDRLEATHLDVETRYSGLNGCGDLVTDHIGAGTPNPDCPCCSRSHKERRGEPFRVPAPTGWDPAKWAVMPRRERRAALRGKRKMRG